MIYRRYLLNTVEIAVVGGKSFPSGDIGSDSEVQILPFFHLKLKKTTCILFRSLELFSIRLSLQGLWLIDAETNWTL